MPVKKIDEFSIKTKPVKQFSPLRKQKTIATPTQQTKKLASITTQKEESLLTNNSQYLDNQASYPSELSKKNFEMSVKIKKDGISLKEQAIQTDREMDKEKPENSPKAFLEVKPPTMATLSSVDVQTDFEEMNVKSKRSKSC